MGRKAASGPEDVVVVVHVDGHNGAPAGPTGESFAQAFLASENHSLRLWN